MDHSNNAHRIPEGLGGRYSFAIKRYCGDLGGLVPAFYTGDQLPDELRERLFSPERLAMYDAIIAESNREGWHVYDPQRGGFTGEIVRRVITPAMQREPDGAWPSP